MRVAACCVLALLTVSPSVAQQIAVPRLLRRSLAGVQAAEPSGLFRPGRSGLPEEAAGTYALSEDPGEVVEMILNGEGNDCRLQGYLTRLGDGPSDRGATLTFFFTQTSVAPSQLSFHTRQVHGISWEFNGQIMRGSAQQLSQKGYYFLNGTLTEHFDAGQSRARRVSLPLLPEGRSLP